MPSEQQPRRWMYLLGAAAAVALLGAAPSQAAVVIIDFGIGETEYFDLPYQEDGFDVAGSNLVVGDPGNPGRGMVLLDTLTISSTSGAAFSLVSFDSLCNMHSGGGGGGCPNNISVQGTLAGGGSTSPVTVSSGVDWATASAFAGFANLASLAISGGGPLPNLIDNIVLSVSAVPLPAALPLLATALGGLGLARWRARGKTAEFA